MATKTALAQKAEADRLELLARIAALEEKVETLTVALEDTNLQGKFDAMQKALEDEMKTIFEPSRRRPQGSAK